MITINNNLLCYANEIRSFETFVLNKFNLSESILMERAGTAAFKYLLKFYPHVRQITICCGGGNNAGDGYVLARLAHQNGIKVVLNQYKPLETLPPTAYQAVSAALSVGITPEFMPESLDKDSDIIIDALLGIGLKGKVYDTLIPVIGQINGSNVPIISIDIPSGLNSDTGEVMGVAVKANLTLTFIARKIGLTTADGPDYSGKVICDDLGLSCYFSSFAGIGTYLAEETPPFVFSPRPKNSHKAAFGHVLVIGGNYGMPGSIVLAASAALRVGAGLVSIATRPEHAAHVLSALPEAMIYGIENKKSLEPLLKKARFCIVGPGLGEDKWAKMLFKQVMNTSLPMVVDASALRLLVEQKQYRRKNWILTPHPGEASTLLNITTFETQKDRVKTVIALQEEYMGNIVLKGIGTLIRTDKQENYVCLAGNPGLASAGTGDVLSGIIGGLAAQNLSLSTATLLGVWVHARVGDRVAQTQGERGLLASDLLNYLPYVLNFIRN